MKKYYVYIHVCPNEKRYVGCTVKIKPEYRWGRNGTSYQYNKCFYFDILKYGWDNIAHEVFEVDSREEMYRKEVELISFYHTNDPRYGYNHSVGGEKGALGSRHSEEIRKRMSEANKKSHADPEVRRKISEAQKGKILSEETKRRMSEAKKGKPKPRIKIKLQDGTIIEMPKNLIARNYINKGKEFEYVS